MSTVDLKAADGHTLSAYVATPAGTDSRQSRHATW